MKQLFRKYRELIAYFCAGLSTTLLNWTVTALYVHLFGKDGIHVTLSTLTAWVIATAYAFFVYKLLVFCSRDMHPKKLFKEASEFIGARLMTLLVETLGMNFFCKLLGFNDLTFAFDVTKGGTSVFCIPLSGYAFSKLLMLVVTTVINYIISKFIIFKKNPEQEEPK